MGREDRTVWDVPPGSSLECGGKSGWVASFDVAWEGLVG